MSLEERARKLGFWVEFRPPLGVPMGSSIYGDYLDSFRRQLADMRMAWRRYLSSRWLPLDPGPEPQYPEPPPECPSGGYISVSNPAEKLRTRNEAAARIADPAARRKQRAMNKKVFDQELAAYKSEAAKADTHNSRLRQELIDYARRNDEWLTSVYYPLEARKVLWEEAVLAAQDFDFAWRVRQALTADFIRSWGDIPGVGRLATIVENVDVAGTVRRFLGL